MGVFIFTAVDAWESKRLYAKTSGKEEEEEEQ